MRAGFAAGPGRERWCVGWAGCVRVGLMLVRNVYRTAMAVLLGGGPVSG